MRRLALLWGTAWSGQIQHPRTTLNNGIIHYAPQTPTHTHRPHPSPDTDKAAVESVRKWLEVNGERP